MTRIPFGVLPVGHAPLDGSSYFNDVAETIMFRTDEEIERALDVLTAGSISRTTAIREAVIYAAARRRGGARMRRAVLAMDIGEPDGVEVAAGLARDRGSEG